MARTHVRLFSHPFFQRLLPSQALRLFFPPPCFFLEQRQASGNGSLQRVRMTLLLIAFMLNVLQ